MATDRTLQQHRRRWQAAEQLLVVANEDLESARRWGQGQAEDATAARERIDVLFTELRDIDPEARLVADLEAAIALYEQRVRDAAERARQATRDAHAYYGEMAATLHSGTPEPYRPALNSPLGRALLHVAARHDIAVEPTVVYPPAEGPMLAQIPAHLAPQVRQLLDMDGFR